MPATGLTGADPLPPAPPRGPASSSVPEAYATGTDQLMTSMTAAMRTMMDNVWDQAELGHQAAFEGMLVGFHEIARSYATAGGNLLPENVATEIVEHAEHPWVPVREWEVIGPFPLYWGRDWERVDGERVPKTLGGFDYAYPPEVVTAHYVVVGTVDGEADWRRAVASHDGPLDLRRLFRTRDDVLCYARTRVHADRAGRFVLGVSFNDGAKVFLNGRQVAAFRLAWKRSGMHEHLVPVALTEGANDLMLKVYNLGAGWEVSAHFLDPLRELSARTDF